MTIIQQMVSLMRVCRKDSIPNYKLIKVGKLHWDPYNKDVDMACKPIDSKSIPALEMEVDQSPILMIDRYLTNKTQRKLFIRSKSSKCGKYRSKSSAHSK